MVSPEAISFWYLMPFQLVLKHYYRTFDSICGAPVGHQCRDWTETQPRDNQGTEINNFPYRLLFSSTLNKKSVRKKSQFVCETISISTLPNCKQINSESFFFFCLSALLQTYKAYSFMMTSDIMCEIICLSPGCSRRRHRRRLRGPDVPQYRMFTRNISTILMVCHFSPIQNTNLLYRCSFITVFYYLLIELSKIHTFLPFEYGLASTPCL